MELTQEVQQDLWQKILKILSGTDFTMGEWGYNPNLEKIMFALILLLMSKSGNNFAIFRHYSKCVSDMLDQTFFIVEKNPMLSYYYVLVQMPELKQRHYKNVKYHICLCSERGGIEQMIIYLNV